MRTVIQGKEITVTIKSERELDTQEIIAAHQLATGNFEALFIKEDSKTSNTNKEVKTKSVEKDIPKWVQVEITCPVCTHESRTTTKYGNVFTNVQVVRHLCITNMQQELLVNMIKQATTIMLRRSYVLKMED